MVRKVRLTQADFLKAKAQGISIEQVAKEKLPKRGRPKGSKNKKPAPIKNPISHFQKTLNEWDFQEQQVDFKELCQKLQEALAKSYVEAEELEKAINYWRNEVAARDIVIRYLESRIK